MPMLLFGLVALVLALWALNVIAKADAVCVQKLRGFLDDVRGEFDNRRVLVIAHSAQRWALR